MQKKLRRVYDEKISDLQRAREVADKQQVERTFWKQH